MGILELISQDRSLSTIGREGSITFSLARVHQNSRMQFPGLETAGIFLYISASIPWFGKHYNYGTSLPSLDCNQAPQTSATGSSSAQLVTPSRLLIHDCTIVISLHLTLHTNRSSLENCISLHDSYLRKVLQNRTFQNLIFKIAEDPHYQ